MFLKSRKVLPTSRGAKLYTFTALSWVGSAHLPSAAWAALEITVETVPNTEGMRQFQEDAHIARELQQSRRGGLAMISSCSLTLRLITQGGCRQVFGLLVCSCLEGYGDNPAPENIFPWKTKGRNIYTIFVALCCLPPLTLITGS